MRPSTQTTDLQQVLIRKAEIVLARDDRVLACWIEGSFAAGTADPWSDVDLHVAVGDEHWDDFFASRFVVLGGVRPVLGSVEARMPWGVHLVSANLSGPVRVDLFIERRSLLPSAPRREQPLVLFDKAKLTDQLRVNWHTETVIRLQLAQLLQGFFFGCAWPVRLQGREEWGTLLMNAASIVYQFLVPAMLIQDDAANFFRPQYHN